MFFFKTSLIAFFCLFLAVRLHAQDLNFLEGMPTTTMVLAKIKGRTPADTYAKQAGTFMQLKGLAIMMVDGQPLKYESVNELMTAYDEQVEILSKKYLAIRGNSKKKWDHAIETYFQSVFLEDEILENLLSAHTILLLREKSKADQKALQWSKRLRFVIQKSPGIYLIVFAIAFFIAGRRLSHSIGRSRFERTNPYGVEEFADYETCRRTRRKEALQGEAAGYSLLASWILLFVGIFWLVAM